MFTLKYFGQYLQAKTRSPKHGRGADLSIIPFLCLVLVVLAYKYWRVNVALKCT